MRPTAKRVVYIVAGEASGDAIGAKLIRALQTKEPSVTFRGVGGPQMTEQGRFASLFPMKELSFMGLTEVLPKIWSTLGHLRAVVKDIHACAPDAVVTIDSKGFTFRVLRILSAQGLLYHALSHVEKIDVASVRRKAAVVHYVAPSTWAYTHKFKHMEATANGLSRLMDHMLVLLPFEAPLFQPRTMTRPVVTFVGHPALEDFGDVHHLFEMTVPTLDASSDDTALLPSSPWLPYDAYAARKTQAILATLAAERAQPKAATWTIVALVGSRENEVLQTISLVRQAIELYSAQARNAPIHVVFPTISAVAPLVHAHLADWSMPFTVHVTDDASKKRSLFQQSHVAIAVSGTVVLEAALAGLPTVVIYRANRVTELLARFLARVQHVSLPNIMSSRTLMPEVLFSECTPINIAAALTYCAVALNAWSNVVLS
ncbi:lipid-A-disaccharide synthetase [Saprolegnia parasitica CBS 223.65]|uniref:lipid-A-disaccharide synthase n=1 Tax=Saprolegnia parasitica (strain CBS 223.65) TaxID=695850 RepID=A0A067CPD1_SAPPC|nr:lipid-A-disaccharide synthetase [Saprolegnia parasitica CBS 223.65]KDO32559.1 lipid-A-disaccharide synthetase [Saprolegnia parasitica CBS 223.65]|eukprot:XP_012197005.1 lipid-A-disaccharide synthetase [Saprolegnia parasitica CBS 223.65]